MIDAREIIARLYAAGAVEKPEQIGNFLTVMDCIEAASLLKQTINKLESILKLYGVKK